MARILGTVRRGRTKITSAKQMRWMHAHRIDHTHFVYDARGRLIRKVRHTYY
jgi:hypothetical protein